MDEELTILTNPDGSGPVVISIGVPTGALKTAAGNPAGNSGAMPNQTGAGRNGGSLTLATGASASRYAGDITASVGPTDCATGGGVFTRTSGIVSTGASGNAVLTARASGGDNCGLSVMAASFSMVSELKYQSK
jgi:hypothetical protein